MGRLIYSANTSLDGYVADRDGSFDWSAPDAAVHAYINELFGPVTTHLYGRRMYDVMVAWETMDDPAPEMRDFAASWRAADKIVLLPRRHRPTQRPHPRRGQLDPAQVRAMVAAADHDVAIGGATLAGQALAAGLVDELQTFVSPVVVGGGTRWLPDDVRLDLELLDTRTFANGVVHLHHRVVR